MWVFLKRWVYALLFDEAVAQRAVAAGMFFFGSLLESGGVIPGTQQVIPHLQPLYPYGGILKLGAIYLGAGGGLPLPGTKNGNGGNGGTGTVKVPPPAPGSAAQGS